MLRVTTPCRNTFLTHSMTAAPLTVIRTGPYHWAEPDRLVRHKLLYFTMGLDQQALRRTCVIQNDQKRWRMCPPANPKGDTTGYKRARAAQLVTWYRRIQYQEYYLEHLFTRYAWGLLRMYPNAYVKIPGKIDEGYAGYDSVPYHRYNRKPLAFPAAEIYERRTL